VNVGKHQSLREEIKSSQTALPPRRSEHLTPPRRKVRQEITTTRGRTSTCRTAKGAGENTPGKKIGGRGGIGGHFAIQRNPQKTPARRAGEDTQEGRNTGLNCREKKKPWGRAVKIRGSCGPNFTYRAASGEEKEDRSEVTCDPRFQKQDPQLEGEKKTSGGKPLNGKFPQKRREKSGHSNKTETLGQITL